MRTNEELVELARERAHVEPHLVGERGAHAGPVLAVGRDEKVVERVDHPLPVGERGGVLRIARP